MKQLQEKIRDFQKQYKVPEKIKTRLQDLASEVDELCEEYESGRSEQGAFTLKEAFVAEMGSILLLLIMIANAANVDLEKTLTMTIGNLESLISRYNPVVLQH
jgi:NTP pyrophosphatase (non-canonical NTP hydrolase)